jgi:RimJ/RimL family protein N-acetyltransferase
MSVVFMESERLWYRAPEQSDVPALTTWINDAAVRRHLDQRVFPLNQSSEEEWVRRVTGTPDRSARTEITFLFGRKGEETPIGSVGFINIAWIPREAEWGILIGSPMEWNKGYGRETARRFLRYGFLELNLNRIRLRVNAANPGGIRAYEAAGFVHEGRLRKASFVDGEYVDLLCMAVLRDEWTP